jgi:hypothetical protein
MEIRNFKLSLPLENSSKVEKVEPYLKKELIVETLVTKEPEPIRKAVYLAPQGDVEQLYADNTNNCVQYAKSQTGIFRTMGNGGRAAVQGTEPKVGSIGVLKGTPHAVVVESVGEMITFRESNFRKGWITRRTLPSSSFIGYIYN